ncbi:MAG: metallophosphoesterase [Ignavibacteria bacterium]|jgi:predicted MPP superfamily phosphohydrolase|nr:metallophosphoesterase [Ignavibacteria bacterium]MCU7503392.1 metallophosphoesterase [Ignavibacteria bacterium]MCU7516276.1 metallophosphoesterase [Ignavibacteria bacterium]
MKNFIIFFGVVLIVYGLVNYYIFMRGWQAIPKGSPIRTYYLIVFLFLALSYFAGRTLEKQAFYGLGDVLMWVGAFWLAAMVYFLLAVVVIDLFRLVNHFTGFFPSLLTRDYARTKYYTALAVISIVAVTVILGRVNAVTPRLKVLDLEIKKKTNPIKTLNIVAASDIHLGTLVGNSRLDSLVERINRLQPDVVLFPGDIVDEDLGPVIKQNLGETLRKIKSKYGIYAVPGNHEFYGGIQAATQYLTEHGIVMLRDKVVKLEGGVYLIGRDDRSVNQVKKRKPLQELMREVDRTKPVIMMDHQPFDLQEAADNGVDLQISGHTHHGQLWPFNFITNRVYELSWGYKKKQNTNYYVSSGFGGWGPPIRTGNTPEIVNFRLRFE